jgi:type II secretory pathway component PulC
LRAATLACLSLGLAAVSVELFDAVRTMLSPSREQRPAVQIPRPAARAGKIDLSAIASAKLFGSYAPANRREPAAEGREDLILSGILFCSGRNSLSRIMLAGYPKTFAVGDRVTGDVVVDAVSPRYAILSDGGREWILRLSWDTPKPRATGAGTDNGNDDLKASDDDPSKPPPILEAYVDPVGDG